jgi:uncharacterized membrane protein
MGARLSVAVTNVAGTPLFAVVHMLLFAGWMTWNVLAPETYRFAPTRSAS